MSSGLETKYGRTNSEQVIDGKFVTKTATATLEVYEQKVYIDSTDGAVTITLPPVSEAIGKIYVLYVKTYSSAITIAAGDSGDFSAPTFDGADDGAVFYSDGVHWWELATRT